MRTLSLATLGLLLTAFTVRAQDLKAELDHAVFAAGDSAATLELYLALDANGLRFRPDSVGYRANVDAAVFLQPQTGEPQQSSTMLSFVVSDPSEIGPGQQFLHVLRTTVGPGSYEVGVVLTAESGSQVRFDRSVTVPNWTPRPALSEVILASDLQEDDGSPAVLLKNGLQLAPNAGLLFGKGVEDLYYYIELYGAESGDSLSTYARVVPTGRSEAVPGFERSQRFADVRAQALVGAFDAGNLTSGSYVWQIYVTDKTGAVRAEQTKKFFVYNPDLARQPVAATPGFQRADDSIYLVMPEAELDRLYEWMEIIATKGERRRLRRANTLEQRREMAAQFWRMRDPEPATSRNEFREEFDLRLQYVQDRFGTRNREGWQTDRGEVVLRYGIPDNIEDRLNQDGAVPHSIWTYTNIPGAGRAFFVFADRTGFDTFDLIHSDAPGENRNPNWQAELVSRR